MGLGRRLPAAESDYALAHNEVGLLRARQQKTTEAISSFKRAIRADPSLADADVNLRFLQQRQGKIQSARGYYE